MIYSHSAFYYGIEVGSSNRFIAFDEGGGEILAELPYGKYTLTNFITAIQTAMNEVGTLNYVVTCDRSTRQYTLSGDSNFSLLVSTGSDPNSAFGLMGFSGADKSGSDSYIGSAVGSSYKPQFRLQSFVDFENNQQNAEQIVHKTASGKIELIKFRTDKIMECDIMFITDIPQGVGGYIRTNLNGVSDARNFLKYAINKGPIEFIPDVTDLDSFTNCVLESTTDSNDGTGFSLQEEYNRGLPGVYKTGLLKFREVSL